MSTPTQNQLFVDQRYIPSDWDEANNMLNWYVPQIAILLNGKVIGSYSTTNNPAGKTYVQNTSSLQVSRKVVDFGALPNTATKSVAHGLSVNNAFRIFDLYIAASNPGVSYLCIKDQNLTMDATNINLTTASNLSAYTSSFVVIEYMRIV